MSTAISVTTAVVCITVGLFLFRDNKSTMSNRIAYVLFLVGGFGLMATAFGGVVYRASTVVTTFVQGFTDSRDWAQAVPTVIAVAALVFVGTGFLSGRGSWFTVLLAVALPVLLFSVDGQFADASQTVFNGLQAVVGNLVDGIREGVERAA